MSGKSFVFSSGLHCEGLRISGIVLKLLVPVFGDDRTPCVFMIFYKKSFQSFKMKGKLKLIVTFKV